MALEFETTCSEESSLDITAMDFIGLRRTDRATRARQNFSASGKAIFRRQPGLAAPPTSLPFTTSRTILNLYAPRRRRDGELHRSRRFVAPRHDALSRRSAVQGVETLYPPHSPPEARPLTGSAKIAISDRRIDAGDLVTSDIPITDAKIAKHPPAAKLLDASVEIAGLVVELAHGWRRKEQY